MSLIQRAIEKALAAAGDVVGRDADDNLAAYDQRTERPHAMPAVMVGTRQVLDVKLYEDRTIMSMTVRLALHLITPAAADAPRFAGSAGASDADAQFRAALAAAGFSFPGTSGVQDEGSMAGVAVFESVIVPQITIPA